MEDPSHVRQLASQGVQIPLLAKEATGAVLHEVSRQVDPIKTNGDLHLSQTDFIPFAGL